MSRGVVGGTELGWGDVMSAIHALEQHHEVKITVMIVPSPMSIRSLSCLLTAQAAPTAPHVFDEQDGRSWGLTFELAQTDTKRLEPAVYRSVLELDEMLTRVRWAPTRLPGF